MSKPDPAFLARPPFRANESGKTVYDADGDRVIVCDMDDDSTCPILYAESMVDEDAWFICPNCGRLGQRMEEATPKRCGLTIDPRPGL